MSVKSSLYFVVSNVGITGVDCIPFPYETSLTSDTNMPGTAFPTKPHVRSAYPHSLIQSYQDDLWLAKDTKRLQTGSEDCDQPARMCVSAGRMCVL